MFNTPFEKLPVSSGFANTATPPVARAVLPSAPVCQTFDVDCAISYEVSGPTEFLFQIEAFNGMDQQVLSDSLEITPNIARNTYHDPHVGHRFVRLHANAGSLSLRYVAQVARTAQPVDLNAPEVPIEHLPNEVLYNLSPTRYCESDLMGRLAQNMFGNLPQGYPRVQAIVDWIRNNIEYQRGSTQATTTAQEVFVQRAGVCRDFAHLGITFCRALNIPARLVVGYAQLSKPPADFHAVFEAFLGGRWVMFDATEMTPIDDLVRIATGRDAKDVAFATIFGPAVMVSMSPLVSRRPI